MKILSCRSHFVQAAAGKTAVLCALVSSVLLSIASAALAPITYTGYTIASGQLGSWQFKDAQVYLSYTGDANDVQTGYVAGVFVAYNGPYDLQQLCTGPFVHTGTARVTIVSSDRTVHATFAPNQISVSADLGGLDPNNVDGYPRGIGFGVCAPTGFEPAYPLGVQDGSIDQDNQGGSHQFSSQETAQNADLTGPASFSGRAWTCFGFGANPGSGATCSDTPPALTTDKGNFYLFQHYRLQFVVQNQTFLDDTLTTGLFWATSGTDGGTLPTARFRSGDFDRPITYTGFLLTDVSLGGQFFGGAQVFLSVSADARRVQTVNSAHGPLYINNSGRAHIRIVGNGQTITATLAPNQIYTYFDIPNAGVGFGSRVNGSDYRYYPLTLTANFCNSLIENSSVGAVSDIIQTPTDSMFYTADVQNLVTNLRTKTALSGPASSCADFDPTTSACGFSLAVPQLQTDHGPLFIYEPYTDNNSDCSGVTTTTNFGIFRVEIPPSD
jgi:hypothetical protein